MPTVREKSPLPASEFFPVMNSTARGIKTKAYRAKESSKYRIQLHAIATPAVACDDFAEELILLEDNASVRRVV
jgi:hypothetical protein